MEQRILIVEDDLVFRNYLYQVLKYDYDVTAVPGPLEAIRAIQEKPFTLMITDLRMPDMDGRALVEKVHAELDPDMMVIVITAFEDDWPMDQAMSSNVFRYLRKGAFLPSELKQNVDKPGGGGSMVSLSEYRKKADLPTSTKRQAVEDARHGSEAHRHAKDMIVWLDAGCTCVYSTAERKDAGICPGQPSGHEAFLTTSSTPTTGIPRQVQRPSARRNGRGRGEVYSGRGRFSISPTASSRLRRPGALAGIDIVPRHHPAEGAEQELKNANSKIQEFNERLAGGVSQRYGLDGIGERYKHYR
jgi:CheY-like chemotaxis protein